MKKISTVEIVILTLTIAIVFISEYYYSILLERDKAIFIGFLRMSSANVIDLLKFKKNHIDTRKP